MNISDMIADAIISMLEIDGSAEIKRNDFAQQLGCVPSQINYVLTSRFKPEQGFIIESKRGGGGFIKIKKIDSEMDSKKAYIMHVVGNIGDYIDALTADIILKNIYQRDVISLKEAKLAQTAVSNNSLRFADPKTRDYIRADILKNILLVLTN